MRIATALALACLCACSSDPESQRTSDPTTVEPDASADASLPEPDSQVDDTGLGAPDVIQSDTGTDAGPDAEVDDADVDADEVSPPACTGPLNAAATDAATVQELALERATVCARTEPDDLAACTALQLDDLEVTTSCRGCVAELGACGIDACAEACVEDATSVDCGWCMREAGCAEAWLGCAGLEAWAPEPACPSEAFGYNHSDGFNCAAEGGDVEACLEVVYSGASELTACEADCLIPFGAQVAAECEGCGERWCSAACNDCARRSTAAQRAAYCAGSAPQRELACD